MQKETTWFISKVINYQFSNISHTHASTKKDSPYRKEKEEDLRKYTPYVDKNHKSSFRRRNDMLCRWISRLRVNSHEKINNSINSTGDNELWHKWNITGEYFNYDIDHKWRFDEYKMHQWLAYADESIEKIDKRLITKKYVQYFYHIKRKISEPMR